MLRELDVWMEDPIPKMMIVGELQDGLVFDGAYKKVTGRPLTHWIVPKFAAQSRHRLIFLTKSTEIKYALDLKPSRQVVFSWSVNAEDVSSQWEHGAPLPSQRFAAAEQMKSAGWPIRFRLDPMVPYKGWKSGYGAAIREINRIGPEMVTLGALRATSATSLRSAAKRNGRDDSIFDFLTEERDPSGFKYRIPFDKQLALFRFAIDHLGKRVVPALCKEDEALWQALDLPFRGCHCLLDQTDAVVAQRQTENENVQCTSKNISSQQGLVRISA
jgi:spore photoproduct lyase